MQKHENRKQATKAAALVALVLAIAAPLSAAAVLAQDDDELEVEYKIELTGASERPNPIDTDASGTAELELKVKDGAVQWLKVEVEVCNIVDAVAAHIHASAGPDANAPVVLFLYGTGPEFSAEDCTRLMKFRLTGDELASQLRGIDVDGFVEAITTGQAYINVHTHANPGGEIRGQLV